MAIKLFESELKVMEALWRVGDLSAGQLAKLLKEETGWNRNTTYTVIKKCIDKGAVRRDEPGFICSALVSHAEVRAAEAEELINRMFDGSPEIFLSAFLGGKSLDSEEVARLKRLVDDLDQ